MTTAQSDRIRARRRALAGLVVVTLVARAEFARAQHRPVAVHLHHAAVVGQRTHLDVVAERHESMQLSVRGRPDVHRQDDRHAHLAAIERPLAVDARGAATRTEYTVEQFDEDGPNPLVMHPGQVLVLARGDTAAHATATLDGQALTPAQRHELETVLSVTVAGATDDEIFGATQPQAVGASWPLHADVAARDLARTGLTVTLTGQSHLVARRRERGVDALEVAAEMTGAVTAIHDLPPDAAIHTGTLHATVHGMFPVQPREATRSGETAFQSDIAWSFSSNGQPAEGHIRANDSKREVYAPL